jgi:hypothetical protein
MAFIKTKLSTIRPDDLYDTLRLTYGFNDEEQQKQPGILAKPAEPVSDSDVVAAGFFDYVFTKSRERAAKVRAEAMEQYARDSAEEAAKIRSILGITRSKAPTGQLSDQARDAMFSSSDIRGTELTMKDNAREAQDVVQPMITPVSRGEQPEMADSPAPVDAPSVDTRSNEMLDKAIQDVLETVVDSDVSDSTDSAKDVEESVPVTAETTGEGLMSRRAGEVEAREGMGAQAEGFFNTAVAEGFNIVKNRVGMDETDWASFKKEVAKIESGGKKDPYRVKGGANNHYDGKYQLGKLAKLDAADLLGMNIGHSKEDRDSFRKNPALQERAFAAFTAKNHNTLMKKSDIYRKLSKGQQIAVLGYAHNQGATAASKWLSSGKVGSDKFKTKGTKYSDAIADSLGVILPNFGSSALAPKTSIRPKARPTD